MCQSYTEGSQDQDECSICMTVPDTVCVPRSVHNPIAVSSVRRAHCTPDESKVRALLSMMVNVHIALGFGIMKLMAIR